MLRNRFIPSLYLIQNAYLSIDSKSSKLGLNNLVNCTGRPLIGFPIKNNCIEILRDPNSFFQKLKQLIIQSERRVTLASLYIGTGDLEVELVNQLNDRLNQINDLRVTILLDYNRGQRLNNPKNCQSSSKGLLKQLADKANISFFLSPVFGSSKLNHQIILPRQVINEIISLQHIKCYIFDDNLIISGANLSKDYFTNRQDRYICIYNCPELCDYLEQVISLVADCSYILTKDGKLALNQRWKYSPLDYKNQENYASAFRKQLQQIQSNYKQLNGSSLTEETLIIPMLQMKCFGITEDSDTTKELFKQSVSLSTPEKYLISGYFNLTQDYIDILTQSQTASQLKVLMASEEVNGFYQAKGIKGIIPSIYTDKAINFLSNVKKRSSNIQLYAYYRDGWTFHAKGFWCQLPDYYITLIGSSNFGHRSIDKDLELQFILATQDQQLTSQLGQECNYLWKYAKPINNTSDLPKVPLKAKIISKIYGSYF